MAQKSDNSVWDNAAAKGFYFHTDPNRPGASEDNLVNEPEKAIQERRNVGLTEKIVSSVFDIPVSVSAKTGELLGTAAQTVSNAINTVIDNIPFKDTITDGLKAVDANQTLDALSKGQLPGSSTVNNFLSDGISRINQMKSAPWIGKILALPATVTAYSLKAIMPKSWDKIVDGITIKLTRDLLTEILNVLMDWYKDPKTLCCLIKNLAALGSMIKENDIAMDNWNEERQKIFDGADAREYLGRDYYATKNILIKIRNYLDLIIAVLTIDLSKQMNFMFDIGKELSDMLISMAITIIEGIISIARESYLKKINDWFSGLKQIDIQCLPFQKLIDVLIKFFSDDHGLFNLIERFCEEYARYLTFRFITNFKMKYISKAKDLSFLTFLRDLINKILQALENLELCIEADYTPVEADSPFGPANNPNVCPYGVDARVTNNWIDCPFRTLTNNDITCRVTTRIPGGISYCNHPNAIRDYFGGGIGNRPGNIGNITGDYPGVDLNKKLGDKNQVGIVFPTDNEVRNFLINHLGYAKDQADQMVAQSQVSVNEPNVDVSPMNYSNLGINDNNNVDNLDKRKALMTSLGDCAKSLNPKTIAELANKLSDILG